MAHQKTTVVEDEEGCTGDIPWNGVGYIGWRHTKYCSRRLVHWTGLVMPPAEAREFALAILRAADEVEGHEFE